MKNGYLPGEIKKQNQSECDTGKKIKTADDAKK